MKLATLKNGTRDGQLVVVSRDLTRAAPCLGIAGTLQHALDDWDHIAPQLEHLSERLNQNDVASATRFDPREAEAPLPRAYQFIDGSGYRHHGELMMRAFDSDNKIGFPLDQPLMYQGASDNLIGPMDEVMLADEAWGIDFEAELGIITSDVPMQVPAERALDYVRLVVLINDISLRNLILPELSKGFGFVQSKSASSFAPVALTPDELGPAWRDGTIHLPLRVSLNGTEFGRVNPGIGATFAFPQFIAHATKTRKLTAGTIIGGGTVSNAEPGVGSSCIAERRAIERIETGAAKTPFLKFGDRMRIEMLDEQGKSLFGAIDQVAMKLRH